MVVVGHVAESDCHVHKYIRLSVRMLSSTAKTHHVVCPSIHPSVSLCIHVYVRRSVRLSVRLYVRMSVRLYVRLPMSLYIWVCLSHSPKYM